MDRKYEGLYLFDWNSIKHLNRQTGLSSDEIFSLNFDGKKISIYRDKHGISFLDLNYFDSYKPPAPNVKINNVKAGDSTYTNLNNLVLEPEQNHVNLDFSALSFFFTPVR